MTSHLRKDLEADDATVDFLVQRIREVSKGREHPRKITPADVADVLDQAHRLGEGPDVPEGSRWIQISDTLARQLATALRASRRLTFWQRLVARLARLWQ